MDLTKKLVLVAATFALIVGLTACGGGDDSGEDTVAGAFEPLAAGGSAYKNVSGEAELTRADGETTTAISLDGLEPDTEYTAHLHTGNCGETDPGGPHFKFDPQGADEPPNEIHLAFTSNGDGSGKAETTSNKEVPAGEAGSIVLHLGGHDEMAAGDASAQFAALFVHEGVDHSKEGPGHDSHGEASEDHSHDEKGGDDAEAVPDKVACAELEGSSAEGGDASASVPTIEVKNGEPVGGIQELDFDAGDQIRFKVSGDEAEEIHVHGYDLSEDIPQGGGTVEFDFPAEIEGIFEAELEAKGVQIAELRVNP